MRLSLVVLGAMSLAAPLQAEETFACEFRERCVRAWEDCEAWAARGALAVSEGQIALLIDDHRADFPTDAPIQDPDAFLATGVTEIDASRIDVIFVNGQLDIVVSVDDSGEGQHFAAASYRATCRPAPWP